MEKDWWYKFKGVYYTNVARSTERNFFAEYQLGSLGFESVTRLEGPDGYSYTSVNKLINNAVKEFPHFEVYRDMDYKPHCLMGRGDLACHWGFHRMFKRLQADLADDECALYCHDDVHIRKHNQVWVKSSAEMPEFSVVQLFWWRMDGHEPLTDDETEPVINSHFYKGINRCGDGALLLTKDGAKQLQELSIKYPRWPMDMLVYYHHDELINAYHVKDYWNWTGHYNKLGSDRTDANRAPRT